MEVRLLKQLRSAYQGPHDPLPTPQPGGVVMVIDDNVTQMLWEHSPDDTRTRWSSPSMQTSSATATDFNLSCRATTSSGSGSRRSRWAAEGCCNPRRWRRGLSQWHEEQGTRGRGSFDELNTWRGHEMFVLLHYYRWWHDRFCLFSFDVVR